MRTRVEQFWCDFFGLSPEELRKPGGRVVAHRGLGDYPGAWIFWREDTIILSTPPELIADTDGLYRSAADRFREPASLAELFAARTERVIGPAYQGFLDPDQFRPHLCPGTGLLPTQERLLDELRAACKAEEWLHAGIEPERPEPCFGYYLDHKLIAVAQNAFWSDSAVSPGLIVHPGYRGRGYGKAVLTAAASDALQSGHLVLYQTLLSNASAVRAAEALGFTQFATHLAIRFRA